MHARSLWNIGCHLLWVLALGLLSAAQPALSSSAILFPSNVAESYRGGGEIAPPDDPGYFYYTVRAGDSLGAIALRYGVRVATLVALNKLRSADAIYIGQRLMIPTGSGGSSASAAVAQPREGPRDKLIPDSEVVYSPAYDGFNTDAVVQSFGGHLASYKEKVDGEMLSGAQIIQIISERFSIGPRVLLAALELRSGWVTGEPQTLRQKLYPMDIDDRVHTGLYYQVWNAANFLNAGYYGKLLSRADVMVLEDKSRYRYADGINPGTAALQNLFAHGVNSGDWNYQLSNDGFMAKYRKLFGDPSTRAIEPLVPPGLKQPLMRLPFEDGVLWYFTGGPHGGWADGSAWAAVDFATAGPGGCAPAPAWEVAAAPGKVVQVEDGRVMINLSGADFQGTGWTMMYMHVGTKGRVEKGTYVLMGDHIGHPACEGGYSPASHLHIARMYNGQWLDAGAGNVPFDLAGYSFKGTGQEYDGTMDRDGHSHPAINGHVDRLNGIRGEMGPEIMVLINAAP